MQRNNRLCAGVWGGVDIVLQLSMLSHSSDRHQTFSQGGSRVAAHDCQSQHQPAGAHSEPPLNQPANSLHLPAHTNASTALAGWPSNSSRVPTTANSAPAAACTLRSAAACQRFTALRKQRRPGAAVRCACSRQHTAYGMESPPEGLERTSTVPLASGPTARTARRRSRRR